MRKKLLQLVRDERGVAAMEFAIGAPMLLMGLMIVVDVGLAVQERMNLDNSLRAGAEFAMAAVTDKDKLESMAEAAANGSMGSGQSTPGQNASSDRVDVTVSNPICYCPSDPNTKVDCGSICTGDITPSMSYDFTAQKTYSAMFLGDMNLITQLSVQVR
jgi:Flp pilus assembly protein TadG